MNRPLSDALNCSFDSLRDCGDNANTGRGQSEPVLTQAFVPKFAVKTLDIGILWVGLPDSMRFSSTPLRWAHRSRALLMNSGSLSTRMALGCPKNLPGQLQGQGHFFIKFNTEYLILLK
jgi:hypothetical protein